ADGGYQVKDERYIPDVGFISKDRMSILEDSAYISKAPDLAVEVVSPTDSQRLLTVKIGNYLAAGTTVWVVYPDDEAIDIYTPNQSVKRLEKTDTLEGGVILPEFSLKLTKIFK
ncbi:MAG: Uma2 family endonuclease, partial [Chloroflexota bacterium]